MRKGIKILGKVVAMTLLSCVVLLLSLALALLIPAVQNFVVRQVTRAASDRLQTTVSVRRISVAFPGKVRVDGFYVEDYQRDTLIYAGRVDAFVTGFGLFGGGVELSRGELVDVKLFLRETPEGEMNIKAGCQSLGESRSYEEETFSVGYPHSDGQGYGTLPRTAETP